MIRKASNTNEDVLMLQKLAKKTFYDTFAYENSEEDMKEYLETAYDFDVLKSEIECETSDYYFYLDGNDTVGFVKVNWADSQTEPDYPDALEIQRIYSLKEYHGHGIGAALMEHAISVARKLKRPMMWSESKSKTSAPIAFIRNMGLKRSVPTFSCSEKMSSMTAFWSRILKIERQASNGACFFICHKMQSSDGILSSG